jgi:hypothetical protein
MPADSGEWRASSLLHADMIQATTFHRMKWRGGQPDRLSPAPGQPLFVGADGVGVPSLFGVLDSIMQLQLSIMRDIFCCMP